MRNRMLVKVMSTAAVMAMLMVTPVFAAWQSDSNGWWWQNADGSYPTSSWQWLDGNGDGVAESYYFNDKGYALMNTTTPDGYTVDGNGAWVQNGVVQTQNVSTNTSSVGDTSNPLDLSHLKKWIVMEPYDNPAVFSGYVDTRITPQWINDQQYLLNHPEIANRKWGAYTLNKAIAEKDARWFTAPSSGGETSEAALAELAGFPRAETVVHGDRVDAMKAAITEFLNSFPNWKSASDFEKAVRICEWINEKTVYEDGQPDDPYPYGALVNGKANCDGLTNAVRVLGWAIDLPVATYSPTGAAHVLPMFYLNGVWLAKEVTNDTTSFYIPSDLFTRNDWNGEYYNALATYCDGTGYVQPTNEQVKAAFPGLTVENSKGGVEVRFHR